ncbi:MAG TPA: cytochrome d ubiquinol oxidase subunit II, partial [Gaiellales bacterium]|nr:cytochrome d ubiquinol oxidase subunit II [Gaiellales bacterium]
MSLEEFWFVLIGVLWSGYFLLEGFDFGVGMLLPFLPRDERERGLMFQAIGPVWDGNEVWLVVAAGATFAAFPAWYATLFSGFYVALLLILVLLIVRVVSFDWRERHAGDRWRVTWLCANSIGSFGASFLWALTLANLVQGVPLDSSHVFTGGIADLFSPYTVAMGLAVVVLFALHGATYLTLRTSGALRRRAAATAGRLGPLAAVLAAGAVAWTVVVAHQNNQRAVLPVAIPAILTGAFVIAAAVLTRRGRAGRAFAATGLAAIGVVATIFTGL